jgi:hypothetical protein
MVAKQEFAEDEAQIRRDSDGGLNWMQSSKKQRKPLQFKEKQLAVNRFDALF